MGQSYGREFILMAYLEKMNVRVAWAAISAATQEVATTANSAAADLNMYGVLVGATFRF
jgi:hypothetical protein